MAIYTQEGLEFSMPSLKKAHLGSDAKQTATVWTCRMNDSH